MHGKRLETRWKPNSSTKRSALRRGAQRRDHRLLRLPQTARDRTAVSGHLTLAINPFARMKPYTILFPDCLTINPGTSRSGPPFSPRWNELPVSCSCLPVDAGEIASMSRPPSHTSSRHSFRTGASRPIDHTRRRNTDIGDLQGVRVRC